MKKFKEILFTPCNDNEPLTLHDVIVNCLFSIIASVILGIFLYLLG